MAEHVCPPWIGYLLLNPLRRLVENPGKLLGPFVRPGMTVLEPGCAMGFFSLPLARMIGAGGRLVVVEVQSRMLAGLERRARKAGLWERIDARLAGPAGLEIDDLAARVDFATALHVVHEVSDQTAFFSQIHAALKPGAVLLVVEPRGHVGREQFARSVEQAIEVGFASRAMSTPARGRAALLAKPE